MTIPAVTTTVTGGILLQSNWNASKSVPVQPVVDQGQYQLKPQFTAGTGSSQISNLYHTRLAVSSATPGVTLDLTALVNPFGDTWVATNIKELLIVNLSTVSGDKISVGGAAANQWTAPFADSGAPTTAKVTIGPDGWWHLVNYIDGFAVSGGSKNLKILWEGVSPEIDFDIILKGN